MQIRHITKLVLLVLTAISISGILTACGEKEVDPSAPVDAPGYYNGKMDPKGPPKGGEK